MTDRGPVPDEVRPVTCPVCGLERRPRQALCRHCRTAGHRLVNELVYVVAAVLVLAVLVQVAYRLLG
jgi:hypothetical protein